MRDALTSTRVNVTRSVTNGMQECMCMGARLHLLPRALHRQVCYHWVGLPMAQWAVWYYRPHVVPTPKLQTRSTAAKPTWSPPGCTAWESERNPHRAHLFIEQVRTHSSSSCSFLHIESTLATAMRPCYTRAASLVWAAWNVDFSTKALEAPVPHDTPLEYFV